MSHKENHINFSHGMGTYPAYRKLYSMQSWMFQACPDVSRTAYTLWRHLKVTTWLQLVPPWRQGVTAAAGWHTLDHVWVPCRGYRVYPPIGSVKHKGEVRWSQWLNNLWLSVLSDFSPLLWKSGLILGTGISANDVYFSGATCKYRTIKFKCIFCVDNHGHKTLH